MQQPTDDIKTPRLLLRLLDSTVIAACLAGKLTEASELLGVDITPDLLEHPSSLQHNQRQLEADPLYLPWGARAAILPNTNTMIGVIRFHTRPDPEYLQPFCRNAVELGYSIFAPHRRQGYANEAVQAMMDWAKALFGIHHFVVSIAPENEPSLKLAAKFGFAKVGEEMDETDGMEYVFLRVVEGEG